MSRLIFPDDRLVYDSDSGRPVKAATVALYLDADVSVPATDVLHLDGTPLTVPAQVSTDAYGRIVLFQGPDGVDTLYAVVNGGPASPLYARVDDRLDSLAGRVGTLETEVGTGGAPVVHATGNETVNGVKTFGSLPVLPGNPTTGLQAAPKQYVDSGDGNTLTSAQSYTDGKITALVGAAPSALDTLKEIDDQLAADEGSAAALAATVGTKMPVIVHGSTAGTARPTSSVPVQWIGSVAPSNATTNDLWWDTAALLSKRFNGTSWDVSGSAAYVPLSTPTRDAPALGLFFPEAHGAVGDGSTDDTAAVLAADAAASVAGGTVMFTAGKTYRCNGALIRAYTGTTNPKNKPVRWTSNGAGPAWDGTWPSAGADLTGSAVLDLRYDGTDTVNAAKIDTRGAGHLEIDHLAIISGGSDDFPIFQTTNTTVDIHHNYIRGNPNNTGAACRQDAIVFGGTTATVGNAKDAAFQGYGSEVHHNYFGRVRRQFYGRMFCNSIPVYMNTSSTTCGSDANAGAYEFAGSASGSCTGNQVFGNTIEVTNYAYGVKATYSIVNTFGPNGFFDSTTGHLAAVWLDPTTATNNRVIAGYHNDAFRFCNDVGGNNDIDQGAHSGQVNSHLSPHQFRNGITATQALGYGVGSMDAGGDIAALTVSAGNNPYPIANIFTQPSVQFTDGVVTNTSRWVTSATAAFALTDDARPMTGTGIPNFSYVAATATATTATPWVASTPAAVGDIIRPTSANTHLYQCTTAGTTGATQPTWPTTAGNTVTDGTVVWTCLATGVTAAQLTKAATASNTGVTLSIGRAGAQLTMTGFARHHVLSSGNAPSAAVDAAAGSGATLTVDANAKDMSGQITLTTGTSPTAGQLLHIAPAINWTRIPHVFLMAKDAATAALFAGGVHTNGSTTSSLKISTVNAPAASTAYVFDYFAIQDS